MNKARGGNDPPPEMRMPGNLSMRTTPLHPRFGVKIHDDDLRAVAATDGYPAMWVLARAADGLERRRP
jgi:hypothetical protein